MFKLKDKKIILTIISAVIAALFIGSALFTYFITRPRFTYSPEASAPAVDENGNELESGAMNVKRMATSESETVTFENAVEYFRGK